MPEDVGHRVGLWDAGLRQTMQTDDAVHCRLYLPTAGEDRPIWVEPP